MPWSDALWRTLILPQNAGPNDPQILIGPDLPAEMSAFIAAIVFRFDANSYSFIGLYDDVGSLQMARGAVSGGVLEIHEELDADRIRWGHDGWLHFEWTDNDDFGYQRITYQSELAPSYINYRNNDGTPGPHGFSINYGEDVDVRFDSNTGAGGRSAGRGVVGGKFSQAGTVATSGGAEVAMAAWNASSDANVTFVDGRVYRIDLTGGVFDSAGTVHLSTIRLRKTVNSIVALQLGFFRIQESVGGTVTSWNHTVYVKNVSGADISASLGLTIQRAAGAGNVSLFGDANIPLTCVVNDIGDTLHSAMAALAVAIT